MKNFTLSFLFCLTTLGLFAQGPKSWTIESLPTPALIDGVLDDACWQNLPALEPFTTSTPVFGQTPHCGTEVRLFHTETALYLAATCFDPDANGIRRDGSSRDADMTGDWFQLSLDTWNDDQLSFDFRVSAAGVQQDVRQTLADWNVRWQSAVVRRADGWTLELCIPFAALRYPRKREMHTWGLQLSRFDRSSGELSTWNPQDPVIRDRVLQFGTLTGLQRIRQEGRHTLSLYSGTTVQSGVAFSETTKTLNETFGIDAQLGLNESTSLDFTILPTITASKNFNSVIFRSDQLKFLNNQAPQPRQLEAAEGFLFNRGASLTYTPFVSGSLLRWRIDSLSSTDFITDPGVSNQLHAAKLSTRTRGNWRFGVYNALLGPVKSEIADFLSSSPNFRKETLQAVSDYNYLTAECLLPNNSFVQLSNSSLLAGPGMNSANPTLNLQLRNRKNEYEFAGNAGLFYQRLDTASATSNHYNFSLARINRRWGWKIAHFAANNAGAPGVLTPGLNYALSEAGVSYQNYRPRGHFLNTFGSAGITTVWGVHADEKTNWSLYAGYSVLDRHFRMLGLDLTSVPYERVVRYQNSGAYLSSKAAPTVGADLRFRSDLRKKANWDVSLGAGISTRGDLKTARFTTGITWAPAPWFTFRGSGGTDAAFNELILLNTPGRWILVENDRWATQFSLEANGYFSTRFRIFGGVEWYKYIYPNRGTVELQPDGHLEPVDYPLPDLSEDSRTGAFAGFQYFFSGISQLRFTYKLHPNNNRFITGTGFFFPVDNQLDLSVIYVFGGTGQP